RFRSAMRRRRLPPSHTMIPTARWHTGGWRQPRWEASSPAEPVPPPWERAGTSCNRPKPSARRPPREQDYIAAAEAFYRRADRTGHGERMHAYAEALGQIYKKYPDDPEAEIFYAYAVTALAPPTDKTYAYQ